MSDRKMAPDVWALGGRLQAKVRRFFDVPLGPDAKPLEIREAMLDEVERHVTRAAGDRRTLPFAQVVARVLATADTRADVEMAFRDFDARVRARLAEIGRAAPPGLHVDVTVVKKAPAGWETGRLFAMDYRPPPEPFPAGSRPVLHLTILCGEASQPIYTVENPTVLVGRGAEPVDRAGHVRRNHVVFAETGDEIAETVGRAHARFTWDAAAGEYRVYDEGSSNGTQVIRGGASLPVASRDPRGVRVRTGDEVQFGRARVRLKVRTLGPG